MLTHTHLNPEVLVQSTGYHAALKQDCHSLRVPLGYLKVEVVPPVLELSPLQWLHVEVRSLYLERR